MRNDLDDIKQRLYEEDKVESLLEALDCENIRLTGNRYEARLPDKFKSSNNRSVQVYMDERLSSRVRSKGISGNIFNLIAFILYEADNDTAIDYLYQSKAFICNMFGWYEYLTIGDDFEEEREDYLAFLRPIQKKRKQRKRVSSLLEKENKVLNKENEFSWYSHFPHKNFLDDGISIKTQKEFEVMFDCDTQRVVFPIYNTNGELISIKGRYVGKDKYIEKEYKYLYLYHFDKMIELYNLHRALPYIKKTGEVIVFESEKSCMKAHQYGFKNTVAIMGSEMSPIQAFLLRQLEANIIFAFDNDMDEEFVKKQANQISTRKSFYIKDNLVLLEKKDSPVDKGEEVWKKLYQNCVKVL